MDTVKVEYVILVETKGGFCNSIKSFNNLLLVNGDTKIVSKAIHYKDIVIQYDVQTGEIKDKNQRFFHTKFSISDVDRIDEYSDFLRMLRGLLHKLTGKQPVSLWDDISFYYASKSYPLIHEIENLMRKFLTKFAITKFESNWTEKSIPREVKESVKNKIDTRDASYLYQTDFIQLLNFLSGTINPLDTKALVDKLQKANNITDLNLVELKTYIPTNNWDKYFSSIVEFEWSYFQTRWEELYTLRCKVAHNNLLNKSDFESICRLVGELKPKIQRAIDEMDKVVILEEDQERLAENFAVSANAAYGEYITLWKIFDKEMYELFSKNATVDEAIDLNKYRYNSVFLIRSLQQKGLISKTMEMQAHQLRHLRNMMVHEVDINIDEHEILLKIEVLRDVVEQVRKS